MIGRWSDMESIFAGDAVACCPEGLGRSETIAHSSLNRDVSKLETSRQRRLELGRVGLTVGAANPQITHYTKLRPWENS